MARDALKRFREGDFAIAGDLFSRAWQLSKRETFLFNAGRAYEKAGDKQSATRCFREYLQIGKDVAGLEEARARLARLERAPALPPESTAAAPGPAAHAEPAPPATVASTPAPAAPAWTVAPLPPQGTAAYVGQASPGATGHRAAAIATVSTAAVLAGAGVALWALAWRDEDELRGLLSQTNASGEIVGLTEVSARDRNDGIGREKTIGAVLFGAAGIAVGVAGLLWLDSGSEPIKRSSAARLRLVPTLQGLQANVAF